MNNIIRFLKAILALTGVSQWAGHHPENRKVVDSIPGSGAFLGCWSGHQLGAWDRQPKQLIYIFLTWCCFSPPSLPFL